MGIELVTRGETNVLYNLSVQPTLIDRIKTAQKEDPKLRRPSRK